MKTRRNLDFWESKLPFPLMKSIFFSVVKNDKHKAHLIKMNRDRIPISCSGRLSIYVIKKILVEPGQTDLVI